MVPRLRSMPLYEAESGAGEAELRKKAGLPAARCFGCLSEIEIGEPSVKVPLDSGPIAIAHHYHAECYRVMRALRRRRQREKRRRRSDG
jgi:hypothetical protein